MAFCLHVRPLRMVRPADNLILRHFGLRENPFGVTPDPRFLFLTHTHREAVASLVNGIECGFGFQVLVAQPGMGKTTLIFDLLERFRTARTAFLFQQQHDSREFLQSLLTELRIDSNETSHAKLYDQLNDLLSNAAQSKERVIVVVDEAQNLEDSLLETLRQLSNFETSRVKLLQIILAGQPQLARRLARPEHEQLRQRISTIARLSPLGLNETLEYLNHRLSVAGHHGSELFTAGACHAIWTRGQGIPRNMNTLSFNAMLLACAQGAKQVDERAVQEAAQDLDLEFVLADIGTVREPAVVAADMTRASRIFPVEPKTDQNQPTGSAPISEDNTSRPLTTEAAAPSALVSAGNPNLPSPPALEKQKLSQHAQIASAPLEGKVSRPVTMGAAPKSVPGNIGNQSFPSPTAQKRQNASGHQPFTKLPTSSDKALRPFTPPPFVTASASASSAGPLRTLVTGLLVTAAVGSLVLFGEAISTRQRQAEDGSGSSMAQPAQEQPPTVEARFKPAQNNNQPKPTAVDDGPEVVVRNFTLGSNDSAESARHAPPQADPEGPPSALHGEKVVFFDVDSAEVSGRYAATLGKIAELLANSQSNAIIEGHTDSSGDDSYNSQLSSRRAMAVKAVLVNKYHIPAERLDTVGVGSSEPIESNLTGSGRGYNRRAEIRVTPLGG